MAEKNEGKKNQPDKATPEKSSKEEQTKQESPKKTSSQKPKPSTKSPGKKSKTPTVLLGLVGIVLLCCICSAISLGLWYFFSDSGGPVYNEEPLVDILVPTSTNWYATSETEIVLKGVTSDDKDSVATVAWEVEGGTSGQAAGTGEWETTAIPLSEGDNKITIEAKDNDSRTGYDEIIIVYNKDIEFIGEPTVNPDHLYKDDPPVDATFTVTVKKAAGQKVGAVLLYEADKDGELGTKVGAMSDNGKPANGDDIPSDGTYGYKGKFSTTVADPKYYRVVATLESSESSNLSATIKQISVEHISQNTTDQINALNQQVNDLLNQLQQQNTDLQDMANQINDLVGQQDGIAGNGISEQGHGVWWVYENTCIPGGILITEPGTKGGDSVSSNPQASQTKSYGLVNKAYAQQNADLEVLNSKALYLGPYLDDFGQGDDYYGAWQKILESTCPECETVEKTNANVTVDDFKTLSQYGLIVVSSHGDNWYGGLSGDNMCFEGLQQSQVIIYTSQKLTSENLAQYEGDLMARRLAVGADNNLVILPSYISHYNTSFPNSIVYISTCRGAYNNTLLSSFIGRGAKAFFGYTDYVLVSYAYKAGNELFDNFVLEDMSTGDSFTDTVAQAGASDGGGAFLAWGGDSSLKMGGGEFVNVGFESGSLNGWNAAGDARIVTTLGPINPSEGGFMSIISTGLGSVSDSKSSISQSICVDGNSQTLTFDYNLVSEEPEEYLDSEFDDRLEVTLIVNGNATTILSAGVNNSTWTPVAGIDFTGGDETMFKTGWKTASHSLANVPSGATVQLKFEISDVGDSDYDTAALIDNVLVK